jgi:hypothetical protein
VLDHLLALLGGHAPLIGNDVAQNQIDLAGHVRGVTTDVEIGLLLQQLADEFGVLLQAVLDVYLLGSLAGEGGDNLQGVAHLFLPGLSYYVSLIFKDVAGG